MRPTTVEQAKLKSCYVGSMSGTSLDGIDLVLTEFNDPEPIKIHAHSSQLFSDDLKRRLLRLRANHSLCLEHIAETEQRLTYEYAEAIRALLEASNRLPSDIAAIGFHGQTLWHQPKGKFSYSWQLGSPARLARLTEISVVSDFRNADISAGGEGAPLAAGFHQYAFYSPRVQRIVVNLGGIANLSFLNKDATEVVAGDTGPANTLLDAWCRRHSVQAYDDQGQWGRSGSMDSDCLALLLSQPYFLEPMPKSTGFELFNLGWLCEHLDKLGKRLKPEDVQCTLHHLTAKSISDAIKSLNVSGEVEVIVCGGGVKNRFALELLASYLGHQFKIKSSEVLGIPTQLVEACTFAWLAHEFIHGRPSNLPKATGAQHRTLLGSWTPAAHT